MTGADAYAGALEAVEGLLGRGGDADDVLRTVVAAVHEGVPHLSWVAIAFVEAGALVLGPEAGERPRASGSEPPAPGVPVTYRGDPVAELHVAPSRADPDERAFLERVAALVSPYCLVGWDTGGVPWADVAS